MELLFITVFPFRRVKDWLFKISLSQNITPKKKEKKKEKDNTPES